MLHPHTKKIFQELKKALKAKQRASLVVSGGSSPVGTAAVAVNVNNYVIPRLRGVNIETDYIVKEQRTAIIASQALGFEELVAGYAGNYPAVSLVYQA